MPVLERPRLSVKHRGQVVPKEDLVHIANNFILTKHAQEMIEKRHHNIDVKSSICNPMLAYFNTDGSINCAINEYEYFVIAIDKFPYRIVTFKEKSWYGKNIFEKQQMAMNGFDRKY